MPIPPPRPVGACRHTVAGAADRAGVVERLSAAAIRHRRLSGALVRRHAGAEPRRGLRPDPHGRRPALVLAGAAAASRRHALDPRAHAARAWARQPAAALARHRRRAVGRHHPALADRRSCSPIFLPGLACWRFISCCCATRHSARAERIGLIVLIAVSAATHSATLAVLLGAPRRRRRAVPDRPPAHAARRVSARGLAGARARRRPGARRRFHRGQAAGLDAGRLRALVRPHAAGRHRQEISRPRTAPIRRCNCAPTRTNCRDDADELFWGSDLFDKLGRFAGLGQEMQTDRARQRGRLSGLASQDRARRHRPATDRRAHRRRRACDASGTPTPSSKSYTPQLVPAMRAARQQQRRDLLHRHQRTALSARAARDGAAAGHRVAGLAQDNSRRHRRTRRHRRARALANAFVCGALSNPHDRYGARMVWLAVFVVLLAPARTVAAQRDPGLPR